MSRRSVWRKKAVTRNFAAPSTKNIRQWFIGDTQKKTADLLVLHPRTLNRVLQARGTSFREARNEARFEIAAQLLRDTRLPIREVAQLLGYSEVSAFTRFFTEEVGLPPSEWRERELAVGPAKHVS